MDFNWTNLTKETSNAETEPITALDANTAAPRCDLSKSRLETLCLMVLGMVKRAECEPQSISV